MYKFTSIFLYSFLLVMSDVDFLILYFFFFFLPVADIPILCNNKNFEYWYQYCDLLFSKTVEEFVFEWPLGHSGGVIVFLFIYFFTFVRFFFHTYFFWYKIVMPLSANNIGRLLFIFFFKGLTVWRLKRLTSTGFSKTSLFDWKQN